MHVKSSTWVFFLLVVVVPVFLNAAVFVPWLIRIRRREKLGSRVARVRRRRGDA